MIQPVRKFFRAGCFFFYSPFSLQCFFLERFKSGQHFFQPVSREARCPLCFVDLVAPVLALIFVEQIVVVFSCPLVKLPLVLKRLLLSALVAAQFVSLAFCEEDTSADFTLSEAQPPIVQSVQVIGYQRIERGISGDTFCCTPVVWIPKVKPCFRCRYGAEYPAGNMERLWPAGIAIKLKWASLLKGHGKVTHFIHEAVTGFRTLRRFPCQHILYIVHARALEDAKKIQEMMEKAFEGLEIHILELSPVFVAQGGPKCVAIQYIERF